jgi:hypothetical protein
MRVGYFAVDRPLVANQATVGEEHGQGGAAGHGEARSCQESGVVLNQVVALKGATRSSV